MAQFSNLTLTNKGLALQVKAQTGAQLTFTRVGFGDGQLAYGENILSLTGLKNEKVSSNIASNEVIGDGTSRVRTVLTNTGLIAGFYLREVGVFATDPDEGEILYAYSNAGQYPDFLPAGTGNTIVESTLSLITIIGNATNVNAFIPSGTYITAQDFKEKNAEITSHLAEKTQQITDLETNKASKDEVNTLATEKADKTQVDALEIKKADQAFVDSQFAAIVSGAPKGTYSTLSALQTAYPSGVEGIFLVLADGHWYYWNSTVLAWTDGGVYQATGIADGSVNYGKTDFMSLGKNRFDASTVKYYKNIDVNGLIVDANTEGNMYDISDYIPIKSGETIYFSNNGSPITVLYGIYNTNKAFISRTTGTSVTASQDGFVIFRVTHSYDMSKVQAEVGTGVTAWETYNYQIPRSLYVKTEELNSDLNTLKNSVTEETKTLLNSGLLALKLESFTAVFPDANGNDIANARVATSDYFSSLEQTKLIITQLNTDYTFCVSWYDEQKNLLVLPTAWNSGVKEYLNQGYYYRIHVYSSIAFASLAFFNYISASKKIVYSIPELELKINVNNEDYYKYIFNNGICIGDSLTEGYASGNIGVISQTYPKFLGRMMDIPITNGGKSGASATSWYKERFSVYNYADKDFAIIYLGTNQGLTDTLDTDVNAYSDYTQYADTNTGNYCKIIEGIYAQNPKCKIFLVKCRHCSGNLAITNLVIGKIATKYNLPVLDITQITYMDLSTPEYHVDGETVHYGSIGNINLAKYILYLMCNAIASNLSSYETALI